MMSNRITDQERKELLNWEVGLRVLQGYRVESQTDFQAVLVSGRRVNHLLHFFISLFTLGFWLIVWLALGLFGGEKRVVVRVDEQVAFTRGGSGADPMTTPNFTRRT